MAIRQGDEKVKRLYKYRQSDENALRLLKNQELYFSFPRNFNDPFESHVFIDCEGNEDDWSRLGGSISASIETQEVMEYLKSINFNSKTFKEKSYSFIYDTCIVYCLSELRDNILMWSHYANFHSGLCIGFETLIQDNFLFMRHNDLDFKNRSESACHNFLPIYKVDYRDQYPKAFDIFKSKTEDLIAFFKTKGNDWKYEEEHRIILAYGDIKKNIIKFDKSILKEVIVGSKIDKRFLRQVFKIIQEDYLAEGYPVEVFESTLDNQKYKLNIKKIN